MVKKNILEDLKKAVEELGYKYTDPVSGGADIVCDISKNPAFGDYSTNVALQLSKQDNGNGKQTPQEIANKIVARVKSQESSKKYLEKVEVAGNGFINFFVKDSEFIKGIINIDKPEKTKSKKILVEYGHVNPLKEIHIGHLRTFILGESICRILEFSGNEVFRANYQGDIGLHIAKAIWGIKKTGIPENELTLEEKARFLGKAYAQGNSSYETKIEVKEEIDKINKNLYLKDASLKDIYELARSWSLDYFKPIYELLGVKYDRCFFESEVFESGKQIVEENIGKVFESSEGAIIFPGEKQGLHNRVFITKAGNPTYEGKEIGLAKLEYDTFNYDDSIHVVASEQEGYFEVVIKAIEELFPKLKGKKKHLSYGVVDLKQGKMSSRTGNVITVNDILNAVCEKVTDVMKKNRINIDEEIVRSVALGAIKFTYLKYSPRPNIVFDLEQSVSLDGDSGPYIQYTYARIQSVLKNAVKKDKGLDIVKLDKQERLLLRHLIFFPDICSKSARELHPNILTTYLTELAKIYNLFYQDCRIIGSEKEIFRLGISDQVAKVLKTGLNLLGIEAPERM